MRRQDLLGLGLAALVGLSVPREALAAGDGPVVTRAKVPVKAIATKDTKVYKQPKEGDVGEPVKAFSLFYILPASSEAQNRDYETLGDANILQNDFYRVANAPSEGAFCGFVPKADFVLWTHREAAAFTPLSTRNGRRGSFFQSKGDAAEAFRAPPDPTGKPLPGEFAREPERTGDLTILMPILDSFTESVDGHSVKVHEVAVMARPSSGSSADRGPRLDDGRAVTQTLVRENATMDVVFVIDLSGSMGRAIAQVQQAVKSAAARLRSEPGLASLLRFGLVGYRDSEGVGSNGETDPARRETATVFCDLESGRDATHFQTRVDGLEAKGDGNESYPEEVIEGLRLAMTPALRWNPLGYRMIVLVGDASGKEVDNPNWHPNAKKNLSGLTMADVARMAQPDVRGGSAKTLLDVYSITAVHLFTPDDPRYDEENQFAERQFRQVSAELRAFPGAFLSVRGGKTPEDFSGALTEKLVANAHQIRRLRNDVRTSAPGPTPTGSSSPVEPDEWKRNDAPYPLLELLRSIPVGADPKIEVFNRGFATEFKLNGDQVLATHVLVVYDDLESFNMMFKIVVKEIGKSIGGGQSVQRVIEKLQRAGAEIATGEVLGPETTLDKLFEGVLRVPIESPLFKLSIDKLVKSSEVEWRQWLQQSAERTRNIDRLLARPEAWFNLPFDPDPKSRHAYVLMTDLP